MPLLPSLDVIGGAVVIVLILIGAFGIASVVRLLCYRWFGR